MVNNENISKNSSNLKKIKKFHITWLEAAKFLHWPAFDQFAVLNQVDVEVSFSTYK